MSSFQQLLDIVKSLRGPQGCPWDKAQTHESLTPFAIEEAYELEQAILNKDQDNMIEELGDLLFQTILHSEIAKQRGAFDIEDVLKRLNEKMIRRHPHVFATGQASTAEQALESWESIKNKEKGPQQSLEPQVPANFPALLRAQKIGKFTHKVGFDWSSAHEVLLKIKEEVGELEEALHAKTSEEIQEELGDLLFTCAQLARHIKSDAELCLRQANEKFLKRWQAMQELTDNWSQLTSEEKESLWRQAKQKTS